jgi:hypothetical protein
MNTREIDRFVRSDETCRGIFQGVFSADMSLYRTHHVCWCAEPIPRKGLENIGSRSSLILNDEENMSIRLDENLSAFLKAMNRRCIGWIFNARKLQSVVSNYCGFSCCFYCMLRCRGFDLTRIVKSFARDTGFNDFIVHGFVCDTRYK